MSRFRHLFWLACMILVLRPAVFAQETKPVTLEDIWLRYQFFPEYPSGFNWMADDQYYTVMEDNKILRYSIKSGKVDGEILDLGDLKRPGSGEALNVGAYTFSSDEKKLILTEESEAIYRRSHRERTYVVELPSKKLHMLSGGDKISLATFSPDGSKVAFTRDNNIYVYDLASGKETAVTNDGKRNHIINGSTDWVYEEEFAFVRGFEWSPDSKNLAYYRFDESEVKEWTMVMYGELYPELYKFKYPKAGEANSVIRLFLYSLDGGKKQEIKYSDETDIYVPRIKWTRDPNQLAIMVMNRLQNHVDIMLVDASSAKTSLLLTEEEDAYIQEVTDESWTFLKSGGFLWQSEKDGHNHVYHYGMDGKLIRQVTAGEFDVTDIASVDEEKGLLYFVSTEVNPMSRHLFVIGLDGKKKKQLTHGQGWHDITFSSNSNYYLDSWSTISTAPKAALYDAKGKEVEALVDNAGLEKRLSGYELGKTKFFKFKVNGENNVYFLDGWMITPPDFDEKKKYPVLMYVYGGPGSQTVTNEYDPFNHFWHQMLAGQGYIVVSVDGRGTGAKGEAFKKCTYGQLGKLELEDQIETAKYLAALPYVDGDRIGIWGWSFGGYMSSLAITKGADHFKAAIAVAPVTNWRFYDTIYTERYLKRPQENAEGYDENSPIHYADLMKGNYLLVHGTGDDNVHVQNSMEWTNALVDANKPFDMAYYTNKNHGIFGGYTRYHLYKKMTDFILENL